MFRAAKIESLRGHLGRVPHHCSSHPHSPRFTYSSSRLLGSLLMNIVKGVWEKEQMFAPKEKVIDIWDWWRWHLFTFCYHSLGYVAGCYCMDWPLYFAFWHAERKLSVWEVLYGPFWLAKTWNRVIWRVGCWKDPRESSLKVQPLSVSWFNLAVQMTKLVIFLT